MTSFLLFMEVLAVQYRTAAGVTSSIFWSFGVMSLALISYLIQDWRYIQLFTTVTGLLQIGLIWYVE
jgi:OCT family organic anion transporter-like MFS transporter 7